MLKMLSSNGYDENDLIDALEFLATFALISGCRWTIKLSLCLTAVGDTSFSFLNLTNQKLTRIMNSQPLQMTLMKVGN